MAKRKGKRISREPLTSLDKEIAADDAKQSHLEKDGGGSSIGREVERQIATIKAISEMEIEHLLTGLRLTRSYFNKEQLQVPILQYFKENLPNVSLVRNGEDGHYDLRWKDEDGNLSLYNTDGRDIHASLFHRLSMNFPSCSTARPSFGGYQFSAKAVDTTSLVGTDGFQTDMFLPQESLDPLMCGIPKGLCTPGADSQRLSVGMTPKTQRVPKHGEMLLSVYGSPLGVYKEDNMEAIHESEEG